MRANAILRAAVLTSAALCLSLANGAAAFGQQVGIDVGGGAGIFRAKNPETKKSGAKSAAGAKPGAKPGTARPRANVTERIEDLLEKGNEARDSRKFAEAEDSYKEILKIKPRDARAAYGLGNIYSDQQRWDDAEAAYRDSVAWAPTNADAYVALSVVLVQPRDGGDNAKRFADAETFARRSVQLEPKNAIGWDRLGVALQARGILNSETEHSYRRAIEMDPQFAAAYAHLGRVLNKLGRANEANPLYEKASELAKDP